MTSPPPPPETDPDGFAVLPLPILRELADRLVLPDARPFAELLANTGPPPVPDAWTRPERSPAHPSPLATSSP